VGVLGGSWRRLAAAVLGVALVASLALVALPAFFAEPELATEVADQGEERANGGAGASAGDVEADGDEPAAMVFREVTEDAIGVSDLEVCRVPQPPDPYRFWGEVFGFTAAGHRMKVPTVGVARVAIIGLDFPDAAGEGSPHDFHWGVEEFLNEWGERHTHGVLRWEIEFPDRWLRAPESYTQFNHVMDGHPDGVPFNRTRRELATDLYAVASTAVDLTKIDAIYVVYPEQLRKKQVGIVYNEPAALPSPQGNLMIPIFGTTHFGTPIPYDHKYFLANVLHEIQHFQAIPLHAPANGSFFFSESGDPRAHTTTSWEGFFSGWHDERHIHCFEGREELDVTFDLSVIDVYPGSKASAMIRIAEHQILVLESRASMPYNNLPQNTSGLTAYVVDTTRTNRVRCDACTDLETELAQWAFFLRAEGATREIYSAPWVTPTDLNIFILPGEQAIHEDVVIEHLSSDGATRVRVTTSGNSRQRAQGQLNSALVNQASWSGQANGERTPGVLAYGVSREPAGWRGGCGCGSCTRGLG